MACGQNLCHQCGRRCIAHVSLFQGLSDAQQQDIMALARHRDYKKGDRVFSMDDPADSILILRYGKVKVSRLTPGGDEVVLDILATGDVLGEQTVFSGERYRAEGLCLADTGICALSAQAIAGLVQRYPDVGMRLVGSLGQKLRDAQRLLEILNKQDALSRLCGFLLLRMERLHTRHIELAREDLAASIHLRRETVSRKLNLLKQQGAVALSGHRSIRILDEDMLFSLYNRPEKQEKQ